MQNLLDLDQDTFCKVIEQLQPIQGKQLVNLFQVNGRFVSRILPCVYSIDFTDGLSLTDRSGLPSSILELGECDDIAEQLARLLFNPNELKIVKISPDPEELPDEPIATLYLDKYVKIISAFPRLREYRISFNPYEQLPDEPRKFADLEFLIRDNRARWLLFIAPEQWRSEFVDLIIDGLRSRVEKYGTDFTFVYELDPYDFSFHNGTLTLNIWKHISDVHRSVLAKIIRVLSSAIHSIGSNDSRTVEAILSIPSILNHVRRVIMIDTDVFDEATDEHIPFWNHFRINDLYPHLNRLTELEFQLGYEYSKFPKRPPDAYMRPLLDRGRLDPNLSFPQITKFELPIPLALNDFDVFRRLFPNVSRFYHIEEYNLARKYSQIHGTLRDRYDDDNVIPQIKLLDQQN